MNGTGMFPRGSAGRRTADRSCSVSQWEREGGDAVVERRDPLTGRPARFNYRVRREEEQEVQEQVQGFQKPGKRGRGVRNTGLSVQLKRSVQIIDSLISGWGDMQWFSGRQRLHCSICSNTGCIQGPFQWLGGKNTDWHCVAVSHNTRAHTHTHLA